MATQRSTADLLHEVGTTINNDALSGITTAGNSLEDNILAVLAFREAYRNAPTKEKETWEKKLVKSTNAILDKLDSFKTAKELATEFAKIDQRSEQPGRDNRPYPGGNRDGSIQTMRDNGVLPRDAARDKIDLTLSQKLVIMNDWLDHHNYKKRTPTTTHNLFSGSSGSERIDTCLGLLNKTAGTFSEEDGKPIRDNQILKVRAGGSRHDQDRCDTIAEEMSEMYTMLNGVQNSSGDYEGGVMGIWKEYLFNGRNHLQPGLLKDNHVGEASGKKLSQLVDNTLGLPVYAVANAFKAIGIGKGLQENAIGRRTEKFFKSFRAIGRAIDSVYLLKPLTRIRQIRNLLDPHRQELQKSADIFRDGTDLARRTFPDKMARIREMCLEDGRISSQYLYIGERLYDRGQLQCNHLRTNQLKEIKKIPQDLKGIAKGLSGVITHNELTGARNSAKVLTQRINYIYDHNLNVQDVDAMDQIALRQYVLNTAQMVENLPASDATRFFQENKKSGLNGYRDTMAFRQDNFAAGNFYLPLTTLGHFHLPDGKLISERLVELAPEENRAKLREAFDAYGGFSFSNLFKRAQKVADLDMEIANRNINVVDWNANYLQQEVDHAMHRSQDLTLLNYSEAMLLAKEWIEGIESNKTEGLAFRAGNPLYEKVRNSAQVILPYNTLHMNRQLSRVADDITLNNLWDNAEKMERMQKNIMLNPMSESPIDDMKAAMVAVVSSIDNMSTYVAAMKTNVPVPPNLWKRYERLEGFPKKENEEQTVSNLLRGMNEIIRKYQEKARFHRIAQSFVERKLSQQDVEVIDKHGNAKVVKPFVEVDREVADEVTGEKRLETHFIPSPELRNILTPKEYDRAVNTAVRMCEETNKKNYATHGGNAANVVEQYKKQIASLVDDSSGRILSMASALEKLPSQKTLSNHPMRQFHEAQINNIVSFRRNNSKASRVTPEGYRQPRFESGNEVTKIEDENGNLRSYKFDIIRGSYQRLDGGLSATETQYNQPLSDLPLAAENLMATR